MDSLSAIFFTSFVLGFSGAVVPGPLTTVVVVAAGRQGFQAGPVAVAGHGILELALGFLLLAGFASLGENHLVRGAVSVIGAGVLFWLGVSLWRQLGEASSLAGGVPSAFSSSFVGALGATLSNPYWFLWWLTVGLEMILLAANDGAVGFISFYLGHVLSDLVWYSLVAGGIVVGKRSLRPAHFHLLLAGCAVSMLGFSIYFAIIGMRLLY